MASTHPQLNFLITASNPALESFELAHLNRRALIRKEAHELLDKWADAEVEARFARWILDCRRSDGSDRPSLSEHLPELLSDNSTDWPTFPPSGGTSIPESSELAPRTAQFLSREREPSRASANGSRVGGQLTLPLGLAATSPCFDAASDNAGATLRKLEHRAQRTVKETSRTAPPVPPTHVKHRYRLTRSSSSSPLGSCAVESSTKYVAAQTSLLAAKDCARHAPRQIAPTQNESGIECSVRVPSRLFGTADSFSVAIAESMSRSSSVTRVSHAASASGRFPRQTFPHPPDRAAPTPHTFSRDASVRDPNGLLATESFTAALPQIASSSGRSTRAATSAKAPNRFVGQVSRRKHDSAAPTLLRSGVTSRGSSPARTGYRARKPRSPARGLRASSTTHRFWQTRAPAAHANRIQQQVRAAS